MQVNEKDIIKKPYILLDWNVIKYLKSPREKYKSLDENLKKIIDKIKKKYEFPFCEAHLRDLAQSYSEVNKELIKSDLIFFESLSGGVALGVDSNENFIMIKHSLENSFREIINEKPIKPNITPDMNPQLVYNVNMENLNEKHPMYKMLKNSKGIYSPEILANWLNDSFDSFFNEIEDYKILRDYVTKIKEDIRSNFNVNEECANYLLEHIRPLLDSFELENENDLAVVWKSIVTKWLEMKYGNENNIPKQELIIFGYNLLDLHPLFREKLKKRKNKLSNIVRDAKMIWYASGSKYFISEDSNSRKKAKFNFQVFGLYFIDYYRKINGAKWVKRK